MNPQAQSSGGGGWSAGKILAVTAAVIVGLMFLSCLGCIGYFVMIPEGGVKLKHEMQPYAVEYLEEHQILRPDEKLVAYYDKTIQLEGTDAYIITDQRLVHHSQSGNYGVPLQDVTRVQITEGELGMTDFTFTLANEDIYRMQIDAFNGAAKFADAIRSALRKAGSNVTVPPVPDSAVTTGPGDQPQGQSY
jgi:hypothetical protein